MNETMTFAGRVVVFGTLFILILVLLFFEWKERSK